MTRYSEILEKVLERIHPEGEQFTETQLFVKRLNLALKKAGIKATAIIAGSTAKGTYVRGDHDIDLFVRFDLKTYGGQNDALSDILEPLLPKGTTRIHGSRDYFKLQHQGYTHEIIPVLKVSRPKQALNVTDMSPLHVTYALKHLKRRPELADQIRLAKQFCKALKIYGAESYINGFSGHVIDLLLFKYGGFLKLLRAASRWGDHVVIDIEQHHKKPAFALDASKRLGPMILVDPVQPKRNAAAALSKEKYDRFREAASVFLEEPHLKYFTVEPLTKTRIKREYERRKHLFTEKTKLFILQSEPLEGKLDVVATKLLMVHKHLLKLLKQHDFTVLDDGFEFEKQHHCAFHYLVVKDERLDATKEWAGPPLKVKKHAAVFKKKHGRKAFEKRGRLHVKLRRDFTTPLKAVRTLLKDDYVQERVASIKKV